MAVLRGLLHLVEDGERKQLLEYLRDFSEERFIPSYFLKPLGLLQEAHRAKNRWYSPDPVLHFAQRVRFSLNTGADKLQLDEKLNRKGIWFSVDTNALKVPIKLLGYIKADIHNNTGRKNNTRSDDKPGEAKMAPEPGKKPKQEAEQLGLKVCLMSTQALFENRNSLPERTFAKVMDTTKKILGRTQRAQEVR